MNVVHAAAKGKGERLACRVVVELVTDGEHHRLLILFRTLYLSVEKGGHRAAVTIWRDGLHLIQREEIIA
jgi:hypothetical protein